MTPGPINRAVVADKTALIRRLLDAARTLPLDNLDAFRADPRMVAAGESYLRRALEALLDLARHVLAKGFARALPSTRRWRVSSARWASSRGSRVNVSCSWPAIATGWSTSTIR